MRRNIIISLCVAVLPLFAQFAEQDVKDRLELIYSGKAEQVRAELAALQRQYPDDAGVKYLDASLTASGDEAVKKYQTIVDRYPRSEWADDALYKVYQYYYAVALYKTADAKMKQLSEQYPNSIYAHRTINPDEKTDVSLSTLNKSETIERMKPESQGISTSAAGKFAVQVGVFSLEATAQKQAMQYSQIVGRQAIVFSKQSGGRTLFAVAFEGFENEQAARAFGSEVKFKFNLDWFLVKR